MSIRVSAALLMMSLALTTGCPSGDGDGDAENDGTSGASGTSGSGGGGSGTGGGDSGTGGGSGDSGLTPEEAASGMCGMGTGTSSDDCTGLDEYQTCLETECMFNECYEGACASYIECLQNAEDPCNASSECPQSTECQNCIVGKASCASNCLGEHVECNGMSVGGDSMEGGACDQLDTCCASLADATNKAMCEQIAGLIRIGGDMACEGPLMTYCP